jgi:hypothetical protein
LEIVARIRLTGCPIVNHNQLDELFKKGELWKKKKTHYHIL